MPFFHRLLSPTPFAIHPLLLSHIALLPKVDTRKNPTDLSQFSNFVRNHRAILVAKQKDFISHSDLSIISNISINPVSEDFSAILYLYSGFKVPSVPSDWRGISSGCRLRYSLRSRTCLRSSLMKYGPPLCRSRSSRKQRKMVSTAIE